MAAPKSLVILTLLLGLVGTESSQLTLLHSYPEPGNFSYVELVCVASGPSPPSAVTAGAQFQLNGTHIREEEIVQTIDNGTVRLLLTQEYEGFFTCSLNGSVSSNSVGLAGTLYVLSYFSLSIL